LADQKKEEKLRAGICYLFPDANKQLIREKKMDSEAVKANEKRFFDYVNKRDTEAMEKWIDEFVAKDFVNHSPVLTESADREGLKEMFRKLFELFPDMTITIKEMVFEKDILCFRHIIRGLGTGNEIMGIAMIRFKNGRAVDRWVTTDAK
jgi:predicted ester cyclase